MKKVRVSPMNKRCSIEQTTYSKDGGYFLIETVWRFATFLVDAEEAEKIRLESLSDDCVEMSNFECEFLDASDSVSEIAVLIKWDFPDTEFDSDQLVSAYQDQELEALGWIEVSTDWIFHGELEFEEES